MSVIQPEARAAMLDDGMPGLVALGGGSLRVLLFSNGVELAGNGYARGIVTKFDTAIQQPDQTQSDSIDVSFSAVGGAIVYDEVRVLNRYATTTYATVDVAETTIAAGTTGNVRLRFVLSDLTAELLPTIQTAADLQTLINAAGAGTLTIGASVIISGQTGLSVTLLAGQTLILQSVENLEFTWTWNAPLNNASLTLDGCQMGATYVDQVQRLANNLSLGLLTFSMVDCVTSGGAAIDDLVTTQAGSFQ